MRDVYVDKIHQGEIKQTVNYRVQKCNNTFIYLWPGVAPNIWRDIVLFGRDIDASKVHDGPSPEDPLRSGRGFSQFYKLD